MSADYRFAYCADYPFAHCLNIRGPSVILDCDSSDDDMYLLRKRNDSNDSNKDNKKTSEIAQKTIPNQICKTPKTKKFVGVKLAETFGMLPDSVYQTLRFQKLGRRRYLPPIYLEHT